MKMHRSPMPSHSMPMGQMGLEGVYHQKQSNLPPSKQHHHPGMPYIKPDAPYSAFRQPSLSPEYSHHQPHESGYFTPQRQKHPNNGIAVEEDQQGAPAAPLPARRQFVGVSSPPPTFHSDVAVARDRGIHRPMSVGRSQQPPSYSSVENAFLPSRKSFKTGAQRPVKEINNGRYHQQSPNVYRPDALKMPATYSPSTSSPCPPPGRRKQPGNAEMNFDELHRFAERQLHSITRQKKELLLKQQRVAALQAMRQQALQQTSVAPIQRAETLSPIYQIPASNCEMSFEQERKLQSLRQLRGSHEKLRLYNETIANENAASESQAETKRRELASCMRQSAELSKKLAIIHQWCQWFTQPQNQNLSRPETSPYFEAVQDAKKWKTSFGDLCLLDQTIERLGTHQTCAPSSLTPLQPSISTSHLQNPILSQETPPAPSCPSSIKLAQHSSVVLPNRSLTPVPSPRLIRPNSAPTVKEDQISSNEIGGREEGTPRFQPSPRPALPVMSTASPMGNQNRAKLHRYASQKVIKDTYLQPVRREAMAKYKQTANEYFQNKLASQDTSLLSSGEEKCDPGVEVVLPEAIRLSINPPPTIASITLAEPHSDDTHSSSSSSPTLSPTSTSASTLDIATKSVPLAKEEELDDEEDTLPKEADGGGSSEDSAIADTDFNNNISPFAQSESISLNDDHVAKVIDERMTTRDIHVKSILRRIRETEKVGRNSVRFHPLALLLDAALEGDIALVRKAAQDISDASEPNDEGITALHNAVCAGRMDVAEFLVREAGADVNSGDTDGWTPLHCAASCGNVELARLLVEHGASLHARTLSDHETSLEKCDQGDVDSECERYLTAEQELLGTADDGRVYAIFPRGLEAAGPGSPNAEIETDELSIMPNEVLRIVDCLPSTEADWVIAEKKSGIRGLVPRSFISRYPLVRVPPASLPMALPSEEKKLSPISLSSLEASIIDRESPQMVEYGYEGPDFNPQFGTESIDDSMESLSEMETEMMVKEEKEAPDEIAQLTNGHTKIENKENGELPFIDDQAIVQTAM